MQGAEDRRRRTSSSLRALTILRNECLAKLAYLQSRDKLLSLEKPGETLRHIVERVSLELMFQKRKFENLEQIVQRLRERLDALEEVVKLSKTPPVLNNDAVGPCSNELVFLSTDFCAKSTPVGEV